MGSRGETAEEKRIVYMNACMYERFHTSRRVFWGSGRKTERRNCEAEVLRFAVYLTAERSAPPEPQPAQSRKLAMTPARNVNLSFALRTAVELCLTLPTGRILSS